MFWSIMETIWIVGGFLFCQVSIILGTRKTTIKMDYVSFVLFYMSLVIVQGGILAELLYLKTVWAIQLGVIIISTIYLFNITRIKRIISGTKLNIWIMFSFLVYFVIITVAFGYWYINCGMELALEYMETYKTILEIENWIIWYLNSIVLWFKIGITYYFLPLSGDVFVLQQIVWVVLASTIFPIIFKPIRGIFEEVEVKHISRKNER